MSLQTARQLLQELEASTQLPTDPDRVCHVLKGLLDSHEHLSQQAHKFNQEAQDAMNLKLSFDVVGGGSKWPVSFGSNTTAYKQFNNENQQLRHMLQVLKSSRFHQEVYQHMCLDETRVFFTSDADLSATCNALLRENKKHMDHIQIAEAELQMRGPAAQRVVYLQQELDTAHRIDQARAVEDLQTREYIDQLHMNSHNLLQKVNFLAHRNRQLQQSMQQYEQQQYEQQQRPLQQAAKDAAGLTAGFGQPVCGTLISGTKANAQTPKSPRSIGTGIGDDGKHAHDPSSSSSLPAPMHRGGHAIPSGASSQSHHATAPPSTSRLTAPYFANDHVPALTQETDDRAEVVARMPTTIDKESSPTADQPSHLAEALPLAAPEMAIASPRIEGAQRSPEPDHRDIPFDAPTAVTNVSTEFKLPWDTSADDVNAEVEGFPDHDDPVDTNQANAPTPNTFLEAACKGGIPEDVSMTHPKAIADSRAAVRRQGGSIERGNATLRENARSVSIMHAPQRTLLAARRPQNVADNGWHTVSRKSSKTAKHVNGAGKDMPSAVQAPVSGSRIAPVRTSRNTEQADNKTHDGGAERLTKAQKKRNAKKRRKAQQPDS